MSGKSSGINSLQIRKQLLIAESELNRALLSEDVAELKAGLGSLASRIQSLGSTASSVAALVAGLVVRRIGKPVEADTKPSWLRTLLKGARLIATLWLTFRSQERDQKENLKSSQEL